MQCLALVFDSCCVKKKKKILVQLYRYRTTWCPTNGTGGSLPRSSRIPTSPTSVPASLLQLAVITGKGLAVKMVRRSCLGLLAEVGHLGGPQILGSLFVALIGISRSSRRGVLGSLQRESQGPWQEPLSWLLLSLPPYMWCVGYAVL